MRAFAAFTSSAAGTCVVVFALLYAFDFVRAAPWTTAHAPEVQGVTSRGVPSSAPTASPSVPAPTPTATVPATPTSVPTPVQTDTTPPPEDDGV